MSHRAQRGRSVTVGPAAVPGAVNENECLFCRVHHHDSWVLSKRSYRLELNLSKRPPLEHQIARLGLGYQVCIPYLASCSRLWSRRNQRFLFSLLPRLVKRLPKG